MFEKFQSVTPDGVIAVQLAYKADARENKIDLGVGVYQDERGVAPVFAAVAEAESRLLNEQKTKTYVGVAGLERFNELVRSLVFGKAADDDRIRSVQAVGGSGALRVLADAIARLETGATVWIPDVTWPNHAPLFAAAGFAVRSYPYYNAATGEVSFNEALASLRSASPGDLILLHGSCHNPTGADFTDQQWDELVEFLRAHALVPFVDVAYHGLGRGLSKDTAFLSLLMQRIPEFVVAYSCSKNFGLYRERVGCAFMIAESAASARGKENMMSAARATYSMPPDHGARVVATILDDAALRQSWQSELEGMRRRIVTLRRELARSFQNHQNTARFAFVADQNGMFSLLSLDDAGIAALREKFAIYLVAGGRLNVAGLRQEVIPFVASAVDDVLTESQNV